MSRVEAAQQVIDRCRLLAQYTEEPGFITRTFLSRPMHGVHALLTEWMQTAGMTVNVDAAGNLRGVYEADAPTAPHFYIGSHLDTVPHGGAFDGILGVVLAVSLVECLEERRLPFAIEIIGFSEEEGVRFSTPFIGSRAFIGTLDDELLTRRDSNGVSVSGAIRDFGLDPSRMDQALAPLDALGYLEFHIEQGPVLENLDAPLAVVSAISGQSRFEVSFAGKAGHAGTTPMHLRRDALAGAVEWIAAVERQAQSVAGLVATVGKLDVHPGAVNVIPGACTASLDVRHRDDHVRRAIADSLIDHAREIASRRYLSFSYRATLEQASVQMDPTLVEILQRAVATAGYPVHRLASGAGHDAMIVAKRMPAAMLFLRSPGGISHHPDETVLVEDVLAGLEVGLHFLEELEVRRG